MIADAEISWVRRQYILKRKAQSMSSIASSASSKTDATQEVD